MSVEREATAGRFRRDAPSLLTDLRFPRVDRAAPSFQRPLPFAGTSGATASGLTATRPAESMHRPAVATAPLQLPRLVLPPFDDAQRGRRATPPSTPASVGLDPPPPPPKSTPRIAAPTPPSTVVVAPDTHLIGDAAVAPQRQQSTRELAAAAASKLPQVTALFWALKMAATTVGETGGDQISEAMKVGFLGTFFIFLVMFLIAVTTQVRSGKLIPALYWTVIVATSAMGTEMADFIFHTLGIGPVSILMGLVAPTVVIYLLGRFTGGSFSVTDITSRRDEVLYWSLILTSNTIGTGVGDGMARTPLGVWGSTVLFAMIMAGLYWMYRNTQVSKVALFWVAFVMTRPLGATGGDMLWHPQSMGGLGLGRVNASILLFAIIGALVVVQTRRLRAERVLQAHQARTDRMASPLDAPTERSRRHGVAGTAVTHAPATGA